MEGTKFKSIFYDEPFTTLSPIETECNYILCVRCGAIRTVGKNVKNYCCPVCGCKKGNIKVENVATS